MSRRARVALVAATAFVAIAATVVTSALAATAAPAPSSAVQAASAVRAANAVQAAKAVQSPVLFGIHDSAVNSCDQYEKATSPNPSPKRLNEATASFKDGLWKGLRVHEARVILAWDVADPGLAHPQDRNALVAEQKCFGRWLSAAKAAHVTPEVAFEVQKSPSFKAGITAYPPSLASYKKAFGKFRAMFPSVTVFAPWNEPDFAPKGTRSPSPKTAAQMWVAVYHRCPGCRVIAGDFSGLAGTQADYRYLVSYNKNLRDLSGGHAVYHPHVWALHPYSDVTSYEAGKRKALKDTTVGTFAARLSKLGYHRDTSIWIDEISVFQQENLSGKHENWSARTQANAAKYLINTLYKAGGRTAATSNQPIVTRLYYLRYYDTAPAGRQPVRALIGFKGFGPHGYIVNGKPVQAYWVFRNRHAPWK